MHLIGFPRGIRGKVCGGDAPLIQWRVDFFSMRWNCETSFWVALRASQHWPSFFFLTLQMDANGRLQRRGWEFLRAHPVVWCWPTLQLTFISTRGSEPKPSLAHYYRSGRNIPAYALQDGGHGNIRSVKKNKKWVFCFFWTHMVVTL